MKIATYIKIISIVTLCIASYGMSITQAKTTKAAAVNKSAHEATQTAVNEPVNINTADLASLAALPGVGKSRAQAILDYRKAHGSFKTIEALANVKGISESYINKNKEYISVK